jgi:hypothetical protein
VVVEHDDAAVGRSLEHDFPTLQSARLVGGSHDDKAAPITDGQVGVVQHADGQALETGGGLFDECLAHRASELASYRPSLDLAQLRYAFRIVGRDSERVEHLGPALERLAYVGAKAMVR